MLKPILFNTEMVQAIMDERKSTARLVVRFPKGTTGRLPDKGKDTVLFYPGGIKRPRYQVGDILYVKETWQEGYRGNVDENRKPILEYLYKARGDDISAEYSLGKWYPSIHMPKEAARIFLRVTHVRIDKLQDITEWQARAEGVETDEFLNHCEYVSAVAPPYSNLPTLRREFARVWDSKLKKKDLELYGWDANPWVWVIYFEQISKEEALGA